MRDTDELTARHHKIIDHLCEPGGRLERAESDGVRWLVRSDKMARGYSIRESTAMFLAVRNIIRLYDSEWRITPKGYRIRLEAEAARRRAVKR